MSGLHQPFTDKHWAPWGKGSVIAATVDLDERKVAFSLNGEPQGELALNSAFRELWPVATLYDGGPQSVRIKRGCSSSFVGIQYQPRARHKKKHHRHKPKEQKEDEQQQQNAEEAAPTSTRERAKAYLQKLSLRISKKGK